MIERKVHIAKGFEDAEKWDINQHISMTPEKRQEAAKILKQKYFGNDVPDVRKAISDK